MEDDKSTVRHKRCLYIIAQRRSRTTWKMWTYQFKVRDVSPNNRLCLQAQYDAVCSSYEEVRELTRLDFDEICILPTPRTFGPFNVGSIGNISELRLVISCICYKLNHAPPLPSSTELQVSSFEFISKSHTSVNENTLKVSHYHLAVQS